MLPRSDVGFTLTSVAAGESQGQLSSSYDPEPALSPAAGGEGQWGAGEHTLRVCLMADKCLGNLSRDPSPQRCPCEM